jgi:hypothetical protein
MLYTHTSMEFWPVWRGGEYLADRRDESAKEITLYKRATIHKLSKNNSKYAHFYFSAGVGGGRDAFFDGLCGS